MKNMLERMLNLLKEAKTAENQHVQIRKRNSDDQEKEEKENKKSKLSSLSSKDKHDLANKKFNSFDNKILCKDDSYLIHSELPIFSKQQMEYLRSLYPRCFTAHSQTPQFVLLILAKVGIGFCDLKKMKLKTFPNELLNILSQLLDRDEETLKDSCFANLMGEKIGRWIKKELEVLDSEYHLSLFVGLINNTEFVGFESINQLCRVERTDPLTGWNAWIEKKSGSFGRTDGFDKWKK